ncbi:MAG: hypothetical protein Q9191_007196, partial [Dirinaria sp. TL-2023a]
MEMQTRPQQQPNQRYDQEASEVYQRSPSTEAMVVRSAGHQNELHHHRDLFRRPFKGKNRNEKFLNQYDGRLCDLIVQTSKEVPDSSSKTLWLRTGLHNGSPWIIRLSNWAMSRDHGSEDRVGTDVGTATLSFPIEVAATPSNMGRYDPFLYKDWRYPLDARNKTENKRERKSVSVEIKRAVEPTYLCFIDKFNDNPILRDKIFVDSVSNWRDTHGSMTPTDFVFVSFTGEHKSETFSNKYLAEVGKHAAIKARVSAYWICASCLADPRERDKEKKEREKQATCWTIGDIVRRASAMVIVVPGPLDTESKDEGSLILSPLELVTVALRCLFTRDIKTYANGDHSYALMSLLRQRPNVVTTDSEFQAFARLSLANDSNMLMERMICLLPKQLDNYWWSLDDAWDVELWDIYPKTQICGIGENDTVVLDGARGAAIRWDKFIPVLTSLLSIVPLLSPYLVRLIYRTQAHDSQALFFGIEGYLDIYNLELLIFGSFEGKLGWSTASSPLSRHKLDRRGMKKDFFEGTDETEIESLMDTENIYTGLDPVKSDDGIKERVEQAKTSSHLEKKVFTLVDTYTMTVTLFEA